jgi:hypothetical protein
MLYFSGKDDYERHKERVTKEEAPGVKHFFGKPESYPCVGIEDTVQCSKEGVLVYLVDFAYPRMQREGGRKGRRSWSG